MDGTRYTWDTIEQEHAKGRYKGMGWQALPMGFNRVGEVVTYSNAPSPHVMGKTPPAGGVESAL